MTKALTVARPVYNRACRLGGDPKADVFAALQAAGLGADYKATMRALYLADGTLTELECDELGWVAGTAQTRAKTVGLSLSDLFFNHQHDAYEELNRRHGKMRSDSLNNYSELAQDALLEDATSFLENLNNYRAECGLDEETTTAEQLVADFCNRL